MGAILLTRKEIKERHFVKKRAEAETVECACGCGQSLKSVDHYGRSQRYVNGHNGRKYGDPTQYKREWNHRNRSERYSYKKRLMWKFKGELIRRLGAECQICGLEYNGKNGTVFQFHHRNPSTKSFPLNLAYFNKYSKAKIQEEAEKCDLLCANCHFTVHGGEY